MSNASLARCLIGPPALKVAHSDGIQGVRIGSREPILGISARSANPLFI